MSSLSSRTGVIATIAALLCSSGAGVAAASPDAPAPVSPPAVQLTWSACGTTPAGTAAGVECASAGLPMDYDVPGGAQVHIAVAKVPAADPAARIGSLFFNLGGPGAPAVAFLQAAGAGPLAALHQRFDIVGFDPRGVGQSEPAVDCRVDQEKIGLNSQPFPTPLDIDVPAYVAKAQAYVDACLARNGSILEHLSTANVARDLDALRAAVGDSRLNYLGFSYGTFLGATYAALFPDRYRALVLDGPLDAQQYIDAPLSLGADQAAAFERALQRFLQACAAAQAACSGFGGADPGAAYDRLIATAEASPLSAAGYLPDPRPVTADDIRGATAALLYSKQAWGIIGLALAQAAQGNASLVRAAVDQLFYGRRADGTYDPLYDRLFAISGSEQHYPRDIGAYLARGAESWAAFPHFWNGYGEIRYALWPRRDADAYDGPLTVPASSPTPLVVATTYDPATPYPGARRLVQELGNARLLTMEGDGHTASGQGNSACIDGAVVAYLVGTTLPAPGTICRQEVPFSAPQPAPAGAVARTGVQALLTPARAGLLGMPVAAR